MPALLDDPTAATIFRTSGSPPFPSPNAPSIPSSIAPHQVTLRDRVTIATLLPFSSAAAVPARLLTYLGNQFNLEIEKGDTYPMFDALTLDTFSRLWFSNFGAIMLLGDLDHTDQVTELESQGVRWEEVCLGAFYIKPNYPGRSSHICNGGFLVTEAARNKGVGRLMGEEYLNWAPKLGYSYSVFNLVYETNVASCRIWDALGFKRIGRVKGCGNLRSSDELVDAIIYGRDLGSEGDEYLSEERFDKIRFYLKHGKYPNGADRAEKSRLRSAATHYKLIPAENGDTSDDSERLMLKDKEVVSDPQRQYQIAREVHAEQHGGINKTTATIAEKYHWVRIKETVSQAIKNCPKCKDVNPKFAPTRGAVAPDLASQQQQQPPMHVQQQQQQQPTPPPSQPQPATMPITHSNSAPRPHHPPTTITGPAQLMVDNIMQFAPDRTQVGAAAAPPTTAQSSARATPQQILTDHQQQQQQQQQPLNAVEALRVIESLSGIPLDPRIMQGAADPNTDPAGFVENMRQVAGFAAAAANGTVNLNLHAASVGDSPHPHHHGLGQPAPHHLVHHQNPAMTAPIAPHTVVGHGPVDVTAAASAMGVALTPQQQRPQHPQQYNPNDMTITTDDRDKLQQGLMVVDSGHVAAAGMTHHATMPSAVTEGAGHPDVVVEGDGLPVHFDMDQHE